MKTCKNCGLHKNKKCKLSKEHKRREELLKGSCNEDLKGWISKNKNNKQK